MKNKIKTIELLAPVKDLEQGRAAVLCGADALYVGAPKFGARAAAGVSLEEIGELCRFAHRYDVRVFVTMNTLLYEEELADAERMAHRIWEAGADALIVQDPAFLRMNLPPIELHASTQMCNTDPEGVRFLGEVGFSRVVLERALSLEEIWEIAQGTDAEIEVFVHGAICVSNSGRCFLSRTMGSRSGNRGDCSQACRLPYNLLDENLKPITRGKHLLSVQDMNLSDHLEELIDAGVTSLKIEGRLKDMNYIRNVVGWYRSKLDEILARRSDLVRASRGVSVTDFTPDPTKSFARGATPYYLKELRRDVAGWDSPKSQGEPIGAVTALRKDAFRLPDGERLSNGDGICFVDRSGALVGTQVNRVEGDWIYPNRMDGVSVGVELFRNLDRRFVSAVERSRLKRVIPIDAEVELSATHLSLILREGDQKARIEWQGEFEEALQADNAEANLRTQIGKLGDTIYTLQGFALRWDVPRFVPASLLATLRRDVVEALDEKRTQAYRRRERKPENREISYPKRVLSGEENVVNSRSEQFYWDHGVEEIERGYDLLKELQSGVRVMQTRYCIRREMEECLREKPRYRGALYLEYSQNLYALQFDCARCSMNVLYAGKRS